MVDRLIISPEYALMKQIGMKEICKYRTAPGTTQEENFSYQIHCYGLYFYNKMFSEVEKLAKLQKRKETSNVVDSW